MTGSDRAARIEDRAPRRSRPALLAAVLLTALFSLVELPFAAFMADDLFQVGALEGVFPTTSAVPWQLYTQEHGRGWPQSAGGSTG